MGSRDHFILFRDNAGIWCAALPAFRDAMVDPTGWGATREEAVWNLLRDPEVRYRVQRESWPEITVADFVETPEPDRVTSRPNLMSAADLDDEAQQRRKSFKLISGGKTIYLSGDPETA